MSIHLTKPQIEILIRQQRKTSFITSLVISVLTIILLMLLLSLLFLAPLLKETPTIVTYESNLDDESQMEVKKVSLSSERKPSSPPSSMAKVIAADANAPITVPVFDVEVTTPSLEFGSGDAFGDGWGSGSGSGGGGAGAGGASFFNQKVKAERIAYVIDYSLSMRGERDSLMRKELAKSVEGLPDGMNYQLIFFAGPAWVAGDEVQLLKGRKAAAVESKGRTYEWTSDGSAHDWNTSGRKQKADWIVCGATGRRRSLGQIKKTDLVWGTNWQPALEIAMNMDPPPQTIFFMTDGVTGGNIESVARKIADEAKAKDIKVNTVAMMEPKAEGAMKTLARRTGGQFTIIEKGGKVR